MYTPEIQQQIDELERTKHEVNELRRVLNSLDSQKENHFKKRSAIQEQITSKIREIKALKDKRDGQTVQVKQLKVQRDSLNEDITKDVSSLKLTRKETPQEEKRESPSFLLMQIKKLEQRMETSVMSFEKEKVLMKEIKTIKKKYLELKAKDEQYTNVKELSKTLQDKKRHADDVHQQIQDHARQSQQFHEQLLVLSKEVDTLKVQEEEEHKKFMELKDQFNEKNNQLKELLEKLNGLKTELDKHNVKTKEERKNQEMEFLKKKDAEVQEKLKKKKKLTTEDILILQSVDHN
jgi:uncharacterized coiled-coil DUF342 family protein